MPRPTSLRSLLALALALAFALALPAPQARAEDESADAPERESPPERVTDEYLQHLAAGAALRQPEPLRLNGLGPGGLDWTFLGPRPLAGDYWSNNGNVSGRVNCVAPHPSNASIAYAAAAGGGVWKTTDGGSTWTVLTETLSSIASGWVAIDPATPTTLWYATGEQNGCGDCFYGDGLFKSTDSGTTWSKLATVSSVGSYVARIVPKPGDPTTLYVGSQLGFVRSTDSGSSWNVTLGGGQCDDIAVDPTTTSNVYASINTKGVYKSTDSGVSWTLSLSAPGRTNFAIAKTNPNILFASLVTGPGYLYGMYKTSSGGSTWTALPATPEYLGGQGWYDNTVAISPTDTNTVVAGGEYPYSASVKGVIKTTNGGASWSDITKGVDNSTVHPDQHSLAFGPTGILWLGNDGGVWRSNDLGGHWLDCNDNLGITEFYTVAAHPTDIGDLLGGTQDNGAARFRGTNNWPEVVSGDGGPVLYQRETPNIFYTTYVRMNPLYKWDNGSYVGTVTGGWGGSDRADWSNGPLIEDPNVNGTFYVGTQRAWRSTDSGGTWNTVSPDLTGGNPYVLRSLAVSPLNSAQIWSGASDGNMRRTRDGGALWSPVNPSVGVNRLTDIALSPADTSVAYVSVDQSSGSRLLFTSDTGNSFTNATGDLPIGLRGMSLAVDWRTTPPRLYLGTDYGVYASLNGGVNWLKASHNMPNVPVYDMALDTFNNKLVAATHGRGMWRADVDINGPLLSLSSPIGGESWPVGASRTITWTASDPSGVASIDLLLSLDGGLTYGNVIASGLPNTGSYSWTVGPGSTSQARVRVLGRDGLGQPATISSPANFTLTTAPTAVGDPNVAFGLEPITPSPGRAPFAVHFGLATTERVTLDVYDLGGRRVRTLAAGTFDAGRHALAWDGRDASGAPARDGVYFVRLRGTAGDAVRRLALLH